MPRTPRSFRRGHVYHLISRFVDREWYIRTEAQRERYISLLGRALEDTDWRCLGHGVMSNHIHLGVVAGEQPLDSWIRRVHSPFADWMNRTHDRIGNIFVRGPKDIETPPERVGAMIAYIHNNPVRAGIVTAPGDTHWTSHRAYLGLQRAPSWLHVDEGLARAGFDDRMAFDRWVQTRPMEREIMTAIEREPEELPGEAGRDAPHAERIVVATAAEIGIPVRQLRSARRSRRELLGRRVAVYCAAASGVRGTQIAASLGITQQAVSLIGRQHDDPVVVRVGSRVLERLGGR